MKQSHILLLLIARLVPFTNRTVQAHLVQLCLLDKLLSSVIQVYSNRDTKTL